MVSVKDVNANKLIDLTKEELKKVKEIEPPAWSFYSKTGASRERIPEQEDWWYIRTAAILRKVYLNGPIGVQKLRVDFGGRKNRGHKPEKFKPGSGSIIRKMFQQLENAQLIKKRGRKGRVISPKGQKFLDEMAHKLVKK